MYQELADMACERITAAVTRSLVDERPIKALLDPYNPTGSTRHVNFNTTKTRRWQTDSRKCPINWAILDSGWEGELCRVLETQDLPVLAYVKNHNMGFEVPYRMGGKAKTYIPDFIVVLDDGHGPEDPLHLVLEVKGFRGEDAKEKKATIETCWLPGINRMGAYGRWAFQELKEVYEIEPDFAQKVESTVAAALQQCGQRGDA